MPMTSIAAAGWECADANRPAAGNRHLNLHSEVGVIAMNIIRYLPFTGRLMIGLPFALSGLSKLGAYSATTGMINAVGLPFPPLAFAVAVAVELGGGLLLIAGYRARYVAAALALFSLATAVSFHNNFADQNQMIHFLRAHPESS